MINYWGYWGIFRRYARLKLLLPARHVWSIKTILCLYYRRVSGRYTMDGCSLDYARDPWPERISELDARSKRS